ncbi:MAG: sensor histidine kinase [Deinococcales bacterium]
MSLRWRIATAVAGLLVLFAVVLGTVVSASVSSTLENYQRTLLEAGAEEIQNLFGSNTVGAVPSKEFLGGTRYAIYNRNGTVFQSDHPLEIPLPEIKKATEQKHFWRSNRLMVLLEPIALLSEAPNKILAVSANAEYINDLAARVQVATVFTTAALVVIALFAGYILAQLGLRPLVDVARQAQELSETNLKPLSYSGARDELGVLVETLNRLVKRLNDAFAAQKTFLAEVAHELRTPVTALDGYIRQAKRDATPESSKVLDDATRVAKNMTRLVSDLLQLSRGEVIQELIPHVVDAAELLRGVASEFGVKVQVPPEPLELLGDPDRLAQLLRNLTSNAVRAAGADKVQLLGRVVGDKLELVIADQGAGIAPELLPRIFDKFVKGASSRGAGLGLAIVAQIAKAHGGDVSVQSEVGKGTVFTVRLPQLESEA